MAGIYKDAYVHLKLRVSYLKGTIQHWASMAHLVVRMLHGNRRLEEIETDETGETGEILGS
jgi:hypothetical protein